MPKSKTRGNREFRPHYNPNEGVLFGSIKRKRHGKKPRPIPGSDHKIIRLSKYMGTRITPELRNDYKRKQAEAFISTHIRASEAAVEKINSDPDLSDEEKLVELNKYYEKQPDEEDLQALSERFAAFQCAKEEKHYKAWLAGKDKFYYKSQGFPVLTEKFLKESQSMKDILKIEE